MVVLPKWLLRIPRKRQFRRESLASAPRWLNKPNRIPIKAALSSPDGAIGTMAGGIGETVGVRAVGVTGVKAAGGNGATTRRLAGTNF